MLLPCEIAANCIEQVLGGHPQATSVVVVDRGMNHAEGVMPTPDPFGLPCSLLPAHAFAARKHLSGKLSKGKCWQ